MPQPPQNAVTWFEIPTTDLDRAIRFYQQLLDIPIEVEFFGEPMALFPTRQGGVPGALVQRPQQQPALNGTLVYLSADGIFDEALARAEAIGGGILVPKTAVPGGSGHFAVLRDTEGNHVGLHTR